MQIPTPQFDISQQNVRDIPKSKRPATQILPGYGAGTPAVNSGAVEIKCVINRKCPFTKDIFMHDALVFNAQSIRNYPENVRNQLASVEGAEGVFLRPMYVYRHTFVGAPGNEKNGEKIILQPLPTPRGTFTAKIPNYRRHQRFIIAPNIFDSTYLRPDEYASYAKKNATSCQELARWQYELVTANSGFSTDTDGPYVLMPKQIAGTTCSGYGVHWRLVKQTPLFRGEDFFVEFYRRARAVDIPQAIKEQTNNSFMNKPFVLKEYAALDTKNTESEEIDNGCGSKGKLFKNRGVVKYTDNGLKIANNTNYEFRDQAYYVIEIGHKHPEHNYFLIFTQRGNPICVRLEKGASILVSEYADGQNVESNSPSRGSRITGRQIIESDWCRVTVRNHLGDFHVTFEGPGFKSTPWIIHRVDTEKVKSKVTNKTITKPKPVHVFVPHAPITLWGGNMNSGFMFGVLQYENISMESNGGAIKVASTPGITFRCPPIPDAQAQALVNCNKTIITNTNAAPNAPKKISETDKQNCFSLPYGCRHKYSLTATDEKVENFSGKYFFTQDAQKFAWPVRSVMDIHELKANIFADGTFFTKGRTYKELSVKNGGTASTIKVDCGPIIRDDSARAGLFWLNVTLLAGSYKFDKNAKEFDIELDTEEIGKNKNRPKNRPSQTTFTNYDDGDDENASWLIPDCITPVLTTIRLEADPNDVPRWSVAAHDVSEHVLEFSDCWSAQDFFKIEHSGTIKFLLNEGAKYTNNQTEYLFSLADKAFYIEIWARYRDPNSNANGCNYSLEKGFYKLFTGIVFGGTINWEMGSLVMDCQINDYSKILQDMLFFNSPFYDGVRDINAVNEILRMAGFRNTSNDDPGILVKKFSQYQDQQMHFGIGPDGRLVPVGIYILPSAYSKLSQPFFKFNDGDKFYDAIMKMAQRGGKCFFFDSFGVAHYESYFDFSVVGVMSGIDKEMLGGKPPECVNGKVTDNSEQVQGQDLALWWYTTNPNYSIGQMAYNSVRYQRAVSDVYNHVKIMTNTPDFEIIFADDLDWASTDDPSQEGFIGYLKTVFQKDGIFGSMEAARNIINFYKAMRRPPLVINFESYGLPVRALDTIVFDGQLARIMKVDSTINPKENKWWNNIEAEWLYPVAKKLGATPCEDSSG